MHLELAQAQIRNLSGAIILRGLNSRISLERPCLIVGRNGAGKTSLLHELCCAAMAPDGKTDAGVLFRPRPRSVGYLPQESVGRLLVSGWDFLHHSEWSGTRDRFERRRSLARSATLALVQAAGLAGHLRQSLATWSIGSRRMLQLAAVLGPARGLFLLDEPLANLSISWVNLVIDRISELSVDGSRFLITTHLTTNAPGTFQVVKLEDLARGSYG